MATSPSTTLPAGAPWYDYPIWPNAFGQNGETGIDLRTPIGTPITTIFGGTVEDASHQAWGWQVVVDVPTRLGKILRETFVHLDSVAVRAGQQVQPGQLLGLSGGEAPTTSPKYSAGPHTELDFFTGPVWQHTDPQTGAQEFVDPTPLIRALGNPSLQGSGSSGANASAPTGAPLSSGGGGICDWLPAGPLRDACMAGAQWSTGDPNPTNPLNPIGSVGSFLGQLSSPVMWLRIGGALLGLLLIVVAVGVMLAKDH